ncbi:MAG: TPM domain-containing protein [Candidatus Poribacteria bacterium]
MKCPKCGLIVMDMVPECKGCGFHIRHLDKKIKSPPKRKGFVNDFANVLSDEEKKWFEDRLLEFHKKYGGEVVIVTLKSTKPIKPSEYVFWLFNRWDIGGNNNSGIMILLALKERRVESEVGYSYEHIISDVESGQVLDDYVVPLLKEGKIYDALKSGTEKLLEILENYFVNETKEEFEKSNEE